MIYMAKMTKAQAKRRLNESLAKVKAVYMSKHDLVSTADLTAMEKIIAKCLKRCV